MSTRLIDLIAETVEVQCQMTGVRATRCYCLPRTWSSVKYEFALGVLHERGILHEGSAIVSFEYRGVTFREEWRLLPSMDTGWGVFT